MPDPAADEAVARRTGLAGELPVRGRRAGRRRWPSVSGSAGCSEVSGSDLQEVVNGADEAPFAGDGWEPATRESSAAQVRFDVAEDGFGGDFAFRVASATFVGREAFEHLGAKSL